MPSRSSSSSCRSKFDVLFTTHHVPHILASIFLHLSSRDFERCRQVCKLWRSYIDENILGNPSFRDRFESKRILELWRDEDFVARKLQIDDLMRIKKWSEMDVECVCCTDEEIFLASQETVFIFRDLRLARSLVLPENDKVKRMFLGRDVVLVQSKINHRFVVYDRRTLDLLRTFKDADVRVKREGDKIFMIRTTSMTKGSLLIVTEIERSCEKIVCEIDVGKSLFRRSEVETEDDESIWDSCKMVMNEDWFLVASNNGWISLISTKSSTTNERTNRTVRYSSSSFHHNLLVRKVFLTKSFFGIIFSSSATTTVGFRIYDVSSGDVLASSPSSGIVSYGRTYFSATDRHFVFSWADAMHNQHFSLHRVGTSSSSSSSSSRVVRKKEFVLMDRPSSQPSFSRPQPMRSMQIVHDQILVLSFYRTASALNIFRLDELINRKSTTTTTVPRSDGLEEGEEELLEDDGNNVGLEVVKRLPRGVIAFQSSHDDLNSQKLVLFKECSILCQRLDYSCENLVLSLEFDWGNDKKDLRGEEIDDRNRKLMAVAAREKGRQMFRIKWK